MPAFVTTALAFTVVGVTVMLGLLIVPAGVPLTLMALFVPAKEALIVPLTAALTELVEPEVLKVWLWLAAVPLKVWVWLVAKEWVTFIVPAGLIVAFSVFMLYIVNCWYLQNTDIWNERS